MTDNKTSLSDLFGFDMNELSDILVEVNEKSRKLVQTFVEQQGQPGRIDQVEAASVGKSFQELASKLMADPNKLFDSQMSYWTDYWGLVQKSSLQLFGGMPAENPEEKPEEKPDKRFRHEAWRANPMFNFIKESYLLTSKAIRTAVQDIQGLDDKTRQKIEFYTGQYLDAIAPSNFLGTNPELLQLTVESRGENLLNGLKNLLEDLDRGPCQLQIQMTDMDAFEVGKDLAVTPGKVVYQNDLIELIQYAPATAEVHKRSLMIIPPWINKYYILDLREQNSMVRWMVEQGYTVFMISWANPDAALKDIGFEDYMLEGPVTALKEIERATGQREVNVIGYCMGGTLLASVTAYLTARGEGDRIHSGTYMASLIDFSDPGDIGVFLDEEQITAFEDKMSEQGYLDGCAMSNSFSMLRANDLVWAYVINNYLKGATPVPFDILFWNSDATNMPAKMHSFYLRNMYLHDRLREPGGITLDNVPIDIGTIKSPAYFISTREDHIALWQATYKGALLHKGDVRFVLGAAGHVAGIVNPPPRKKYGHWTNDQLPDTASKWLEDAEFHQSSWWLNWVEWNAPYAGEKVPARKPGGSAADQLDDAPGCYVTNRLDRPESGVCYMPNALL
ncbi:MAG: class I poly(R)-hydroxyalkanoic acid synthase [Deltaproteobacteria bacterium]|nr:class I poly(R)-hydroxyalkanoic acid synthase [Deltaproteobacteria bacterium]